MPDNVEVAVLAANVESLVKRMDAVLEEVRSLAKETHSHSLRMVEHRADIAALEKSLGEVKREMQDTAIDHESRIKALEDLRSEAKGFSRAWVLVAGLVGWLAEHLVSIFIKGH